MKFGIYFKEQSSLIIYIEVLLQRSFILQLLSSFCNYLVFKIENVKENVEKDHPYENHECQILVKKVVIGSSSSVGVRESSKYDQCQACIKAINLELIKNKLPTPRVR